MNERKERLTRKATEAWDTAYEYAETGDERQCRYFRALAKMYEMLLEKTT